MSNSLNVVWLVGVVGKDAQMKMTQAGKSFVNFSMATTRQWGEKQLTDWHQVTVWGKAARELRKGTQVMVKGEYVTNSWEDAEGKRQYRQQVNAFSLSVEPSEEYVPRSHHGGHEGDQEDAPF